MANQRSKEKAFLGGYIPREDKRAFNRACKITGKDATSLFLELVMEGLKRRKLLEESAPEKKK